MRSFSLSPVLSANYNTYRLLSFPPCHYCFHSTPPSVPWCHSSIFILIVIYSYRFYSFSHYRFFHQSSVGRFLPLLYMLFIIYLRFSSFFFVLLFYIFPLFCFVIWCHYYHRIHLCFLCSTLLFCSFLGAIIYRYLLFLCSTLFYYYVFLCHYFPFFLCSIN